MAPHSHSNFNSGRVIKHSKNDGSNQAKLLCLFHTVKEMERVELICNCIAIGVKEIDLNDEHLHCIYVQTNTTKY